MFKIRPTQNEIEHLKDKFEHSFKKQFMQTIRGPMIAGNSTTKEAKEQEAGLFFDHVLDSFEKNEDTQNLENLEKEFYNHMNFKLQLARRKTNVAS